MIIDCDRCEVRGDACGECVVGVLLGVTDRSEADDAPRNRPFDVPSGAPIVQLDAPERRALDVLADQGLVPKLRLVATPTRRTSAGAASEGAVRDVG
jgi:hypothetical protein